MFLSLGDDYILNVLHEVQLHEEVEAGDVMCPWDQIRLMIGPPNWEVPTMTPMILCHEIQM